MGISFFLGLLAYLGIMIALTLWLTWFHELKLSEPTSERFTLVEFAEDTAESSLMELEEDQSSLVGED